MVNLNYTIRDPHQTDPPPPPLFRGLFLLCLWPAHHSTLSPLCLVNSSLTGGGPLFQFYLIFHFYFIFRYKDFAVFIPIQTHPLFSLTCVPNLPEMPSSFWIYRQPQGCSCWDTRQAKTLNCHGTSLSYGVCSWHIWTWYIWVHS